MTRIRHPLAAVLAAAALALAGCSSDPSPVVSAEALAGALDSSDAVTLEDCGSGGGTGQDALLRFCSYSVSDTDLTISFEWSDVESEYWQGTRAPSYESADLGDETRIEVLVDPQSATDPQVSLLFEDGTLGWRVSARQIVEDRVYLTEHADDIRELLTAQADAAARVLLASNSRPTTW
jgi:hypothetical protein